VELPLLLPELLLPELEPELLPELLLPELEPLPDEESGPPGSPELLLHPANANAAANVAVTRATGMRGFMGDRS
jgi:hypothetical protein